MNKHCTLRAEGKTEIDPPEKQSVNIKVINYYSIPEESQNKAYLSFKNRFIWLTLKIFKSQWVSIIIHYVVSYLLYREYTISYG